MSGGHVTHFAPRLKLKWINFKSGERLAIELKMRKKNIEQVAVGVLELECRERLTGPMIVEV